MLEHEKWLSIAYEDILVARAIIRLGFFSTATYHCQQAAEKSLKGYLAFKEQEITKTHDLVKLVGLCKHFDQSFEKLYDIAEQLNPFATKFRYPTEFDIPSHADTQAALKQASSTWNFVIKKIKATKNSQLTIC